MQSLQEAQIVQDEQRKEMWMAWTQMMWRVALP